MKLVENLLGVLSLTLTLSNNLIKTFKKYDGKAKIFKILIFSDIDGFNANKDSLRSDMQTSTAGRNINNVQVVFSQSDIDQISFHFRLKFLFRNNSVSFLN